MDESRPYAAPYSSLPCRYGCSQHQALLPVLPVQTCPPLEELLVELEELLDDTLDDEELVELAEEELLDDALEALLEELLVPLEVTVRVA